MRFIKKEIVSIALIVSMLLSSNGVYGLASSSDVFNGVEGNTKKNYALMESAEEEASTDSTTDSDEGETDNTGVDTEEPESEQVSCKYCESVDIEVSVETLGIYHCNCCDKFFQYTYSENAEPISSQIDKIKNTDKESKVESEDTSQEQKTETAKVDIASESEVEQSTSSEMQTDASISTINVLHAFEGEEDVSDNLGKASASKIASSESKTLRQLDGSLTFEVIKNKHFGDNFYVNGNKWNQYNKQLWEFHHIREAWEFIYEKKFDGNLNIDNDYRVGVEVLDHNFYSPKATNASIASNEMNKNIVYSVVEDKLDNLKTYKVNEDDAKKFVTFGIDKSKILERTHGTNVVSIIGNKYEDVENRYGLESKFSGVASGYNNDLIRIYQCNESPLNNIFENEIYTKHFATEKKNLKVINISLSSIDAISLCEQLKSGIGFPIFIDNYKKISHVYAAGNNCLSKNSNLLLDSKERNARIHKIIDEGIYVGALQCSANAKYIEFDNSIVTDKKWNHDSYGDCYYYSEYTDRGEMIDIYACANNIVNFSENAEERFDGTSSAAPVVSGIIALMYYVNKDLTPRQVKNILYKTADTIEEGFTKDKIRVVNGKKAVEVAYELNTKNIIENPNRVIFKKTNYAMNDKSNKAKLKLTKNDYIENSIALWRPYFYDCNIDNYEDYYWEIDTVDGKTFKAFEDSGYKGMYNIEDNVFWVNKDLEYIDNENKLKKHTVEIVFKHKDGEVCKEFDEEGRLVNDRIIVEIYPNEHIVKNTIRNRKYALGASAFINPYRMVGIKLFDKSYNNKKSLLIFDEPSKTKYNRDVVRMRFSSNGKNEIAEVVKVSSDSVSFLPDVNIDGANIRIKGLNQVQHENLDYEHMDNNSYGFQNMYFDYKEQKSYEVPDDELKREYIYTDVCKDFVYNSVKFSYRHGIGHGEKWVDPKDAFNDPTISKKVYLYLRRSTKKEKAGTLSQVVTIPKRNILLTEIEEENANERDMILLPDDDNCEYIATNKKFKIIVSKGGNDKSMKIKVEPFTIEYYKTENEHVMFRYILVDKDFNIKNEPDKIVGYSDNQVIIYDLLSLNRKNDIAEFKYEDIDINISKKETKYVDIYTENDFYEYSLKQICGLSKDYNIYLFLERFGDGDVSTGTKFVPIEVVENKDDDNNEHIKKFLTKVADGQSMPTGDSDVTNGKMIHKFQILPKNSKKKSGCCFWCIWPFKKKTDEIVEGEETVRVVSLKDVYEVYGVPYETEDGRLVGGIVKCKHGEYSEIGLNDYLLVDAESAEDKGYEIETIREKAESIRIEDGGEKLVIYDIENKTEWVEYKSLREIRGETGGHRYYCVHEMEHYGSEMWQGAGSVEEVEEILDELESSEIGVIKLRDVYEKAGIKMEGSRGKIIGGEVECEHGYKERLGMDDYLLVDSTYTIKPIRGYEGFFGIYEILGIREIGKRYIQDCGKYMEWALGGIFKEAKGNDISKRFPVGRKREEVEIGQGEEGELTQGMRVLKVEIEEEEGMEEEEIERILSDEVISYDDFVRYIKVDLRGVAPEVEELVDKNFEGYVNNEGKRVEECYLNEKISEVYSEPKSIKIEEEYRVDVREGRVYIYKYRIPIDGKYYVVGYNSRVVDTPLIEVYKVRDGKAEGVRRGIERVEGEYKAGEEIYIKGRMATGRTGGFYLSVLRYDAKKPIRNIAVVKTADKTKYKLLETFNPSGLRIRLMYKDNTIEEVMYNDSIKTKFSFNPSLSTKLSTSNKKVDITYGGKVVSQSIEVIKELSSISVKTAPKKVKYKVGEKFVADGLKIKLTYNDNSSEEVVYNNSTKGKFSFSPSLSTQLNTGNKQVTVGYSGKKVSQGIQVIEFTKVEVKTNPKKMSYYKVAWDKFDPTGLVINMVYSDNVTKEAVAYNDSTKGDFKFGGSFTVSGSTGYMSYTYKGKTGRIEVKMLEPETWIKDIKISSNKKKDKARNANYPGYTRIDVDLNKGAGGDYIYLWYSTTQNKNEAIKDIKLTFNTTESKRAPGYTLIGNDLNQGAGGDEIYLWYTREGEKAIKKLMVEDFGSEQSNKAGWYTAKGIRIKTVNIWQYIFGGGGKVDGEYSDLNKKAKGRWIYLRYQY